MPRSLVDEIGGTNVAAGLDMIRYSEIGRQMLADPATDSGYRVIVGSTPGKLILMDNYDAHPNRRIFIPKIKDWSTAAGGYQLLHRYWVSYRDLLKLTNFDPFSQDKIAVQQIKERKAFVLLQQGKIEDAIERIRNIWASLPGAGYGQHENDLQPLVAMYEQYGGQHASA